MSSIIKVDTIQDQDGNNIINENADVITVGASGDTITIPAGATFDSSAATNTLPATVVTTTGTQTLTNKSIATTQLTGTVATSNLGTGTADATTFLRGDQTYAEAGGGKILQVVEGSSTTQHEATGSSNQDIGLSVNITPSATSSKIYVVADFLYSIFKSGAYGSEAQFAVLRDSTTIIAGSGGTGQDYNVEASALATNSYVTMAGINTMQILDAPSSTSEITYKVQSSGISSTRVRSMLNGVRGSIVAMEVSV